MMWWVHVSQRAALESARGEWEALSRERADMASEVQALEAALGNLNAQVGRQAGRHTAAAAAAAALPLTQ